MSGEGRKPGELLWMDLGQVLTDPATGGKKNMRITRFDLMPPEALSEIASTFGAGALKYPDDPKQMNWERGMPYSWLVRAFETHIQKWRSGVDFDSDDGMHHLAHAAALMMMLMTYQARDLGTDDRPKANKIDG